MIQSSGEVVSRDAVRLAFFPSGHKEPAGRDKQQQGDLDGEYGGVDFFTVAGFFIKDENFVAADGGDAVGVAPDEIMTDVFELAVGGCLAQPGGKEDHYDQNKKSQGDDILSLFVHLGFPG